MCQSQTLIDLRPSQHDNGYMDGRSQIKVHTDERTQVHSAQSSLAVTHPSNNHISETVRPGAKRTNLRTDRILTDVVIPSSSPIRFGCNRK